MREYFFTGCGFDFEKIAALASQPVGVNRTLVGAYARDAKLSSDWLLDRLERTTPLGAGYGSTELTRLWREFVWSDPAHAQLVLESHPEALVTLQEPLLHQAPQRVLPLLFREAEGDTRPLNTASDHPLRVIEDWIVQAPRHSDQPQCRRRLLLEATEAWLNAGGDETVAAHALQLVMSAEFRLSEPDPADEDRYSYSIAAVTVAQTEAIASLWPRITRLVREGFLDRWRAICGILARWAYPHFPHAQLSDAHRDVFRATARLMLRDLVDLAEGHPAVLQVLRRTAADLQSDHVILIDAEFEALYPAEDFAPDWQAREAQRRAAADDLAQRWTDLEPEDALMARWAMLRRHSRSHEAG